MTPVQVPVGVAMVCQTHHCSRYRVLFVFFVGSFYSVQYSLKQKEEEEEVPIYNSPNCFVDG